MKAWQFVGAGRPLELNEVGDPSPGPGEVLIEVRASGLCHTEIGFIEGVLPEVLLAHVPLTFGHEIAGVIAALGSGVDEFSEGQPVGVLSGVAGPAFGYDGGFAPRLVAPVDHVVAAPEGVAFERLAVGADAGMVAHRAVVVRAEVKAGMRVGIMGLGGVGLCGAQIAAMRGAEVYAAEPRTTLHQHASRWGLTKVVDDGARLAGLDLDVVIDFAGVSTTTAAAVEAVRVDGVVVLVGSASPTTTVSTTSLIAKKVQLLGHVGAEHEDVLAFWDYLERGLDPMVTPISFEEIGDGLDRLGRGEVYGRLVAVLD